MESINNDPAWKWADSDVFRTMLGDAKNKLMSFKCSHDFWSQWLLQPKFNFATARRQYNIDIIQEQLERARELEAALGNCEKQVNKVIGMHQQTRK